MLRSALLLLLAAAAAFAAEPVYLGPDRPRRSWKERGLPYNDIIARAVEDYDRSGKPQPVCVHVESLPGPVSAPPDRGPERLRLYDQPPGSLPPPFSREGYVMLTSATTIRMNKEKGELDVDFPEADFGGGAFGARAELFVRLEGTPSKPAVSWAAVFCKGGSYVGYKGSTVAFPSRSGRFSLKETAALGAPKLLITRTHHWLTAGMVSLEDLCTEGFSERMKGARAATLPPRAGAYVLKYNARKNSLKVTW